MENFTSAFQSVQVSPFPANTCSAHSESLNCKTIGLAYQYVNFRQKKKAGPISADDDIGAEIISFSDGVVNRDIPALYILDTVLSKLPFACAGAFRIAVVVLRVDNNTSLLVGEIGDNVAPALVIVYAKRDDEFLVVFAHKAQGTGRAAATHLENVLAV